MGDFSVPGQFIFPKRRGCTWVEWKTAGGHVVFVMLRTPDGSERCIRHFRDINDFNQALVVFNGQIAPKIDEDVQGGSNLKTWKDVTKHYYPDDSKKSWQFIFSWDEKWDGGLILYHLNPPGYEFDEPFVASQRHQDWWDDDPDNANLSWPFS